ncbi:MAG: preprotein translocase subunit SecE [Oligoflexia bacterium]|nr:preprotein translocase subunit SecE [Oligoflexia bacterium]
MASERAESQTTAESRGSYLSASIAELKKVTFPTRQETTQATLVTLVIIAFVAICLFVLDVIFNRLMAALLS